MVLRGLTVGQLTVSVIQYLNDRSDIVARYLQQSGMADFVMQYGLRMVHRGSESPLPRHSLIAAGPGDVLFPAALCSPLQRAGRVVDGTSYVIWLPLPPLPR